MMNLFRISLMYLFAFILINPTISQEDTLSLSGAINRALENNYNIIITRADLDIAEINNNWGNAGRYPTIGFEATANNSFNNSNETFTNRLTAGIGLSWIIFDGFRVNITKDQLENLEMASAGQLAVTVETLVEDVILGYYSALLERERLNVLKTVMDLSRDRYDYELTRQRLGGAVTYDVLQAQNVYLSDKTTFMNQEVVVRNSIRYLNFLMSEDPASNWHFSEAFEADTGRYILGDLISRMKANNQTLRNQYINLMLKQNAAELNRSNYFPSLSLSTGLDNTYTNAYNNTTGNTGKNIFSPYGNLRLSYDIYAAGRRKRSLEIARINEEIARVEIEKMEHLLINEIFNIYDYYEVRIALLKVATEGLAAAELNMDIAEEKYRSGVINSFNYRDIQLIYLNAALQKLQAIYNLIDSKTGLTRITGGFLNSEID